MGKAIMTAGAIGAIIIGTLPFLFLLWDHPFIGGTPDIVTFAQHTKTTIQEKTLSARAEHGYFTAIQLFPQLILENTALTLLNDQMPLLNLWILQHITTLVMSALFFLLGRMITRSILGGILSVLSNIALLDIPIFVDSGFPRFLSTYFFSQLFFIALITYSAITLPMPMPYFSRRLLLFFMISGMLFSHHHFGVIRTIGLAIAFFFIGIFKSTPTMVIQRAVVPGLQMIAGSVTIWIALNYPLIPFFIQNFVR